MSWEQNLLHSLPYFQCLPPNLQHRLRDDVKIFIAEKHFEGVHGLDVTDEMRVVIAAQACVLELGRTPTYYNSLKSIIVYPSTFVTSQRAHIGAGAAVVKPLHTLGQWSSTGAMALAWDSVLEGARDIGDGQNVVFHEFAHQLDSVNGSVNGAPDLVSRARYMAWARVMSREFDQLKMDTHLGLPTVISTYGATNPGEFFAVATEAFFERPTHLRAMHPALYDQLRTFYGQDPADWSCSSINR